MKTRIPLLCTLLLLLCGSAQAQFRQELPDDVILLDTVIQLKEVSIVRFRNPDEEKLFRVFCYRIRKVQPYVKIAKSLYAEMQQEKEASKKREYKKYRKEVEAEMRDKFEKELRDLTIGQGEMLVKLINRETGNNCYTIIKDVKGGFNAWGWQIVAKKYGYNLKEQYDPQREYMIELAIRSLGTEYNP